MDKLRRSLYRKKRNVIKDAYCFLDINDIVANKEQPRTHFEDEKIQEIISDPEADIDQKGSALLREANQNGGKDNIAIVLVEPFTNEVEAC